MRGRQWRLLLYVLHGAEQRQQLLRAIQLLAQAAFQCGHGGERASGHEQARSVGVERQAQPLQHLQRSGERKRAAGGTVSKHAVRAY